jgi:hypothetical protein
MRWLAEAQTMVPSSTWTIHRQMRARLWRVATVNDSALA